MGKKLDKYVEMFMNHPQIDKRYDEKGLMNHLGINNEGGICDGYCHHHKCNFYLLEGKTASHITKAISQLKNTAEQLIKNGHKINRAIIFCKKIPRSERKLYRQGKDYLLYTRNGLNPIKLKGNIDIYIFYWRNCSEVGIGWHFG